MYNCVHGLPAAWCAICNRAVLAAAPFMGMRDDDIRLRIRPPITGGFIPRFERIVRYPAAGIGSTGDRGPEQMRQLALAACKRGTWTPTSDWGRESIAGIVRSKLY